jgi:glyoxylase-like metal-dependent hydrolase (beta-lactamase superfamily II)
MIARRPSMMTVLAPGIGYADLEFQQQPRIIATGVISGADGVTLVDPGPASTLPALRRHLAAAGMAVADITALFLTHIHLDHAGATGTLLRENPDIRVYVHEAGAPHMVEPGKLVASATRLYGDAMDRLWGAVLPAPATAITALRGGERLAAGGRSWDVAYTPGHASHHVSYFDAGSGLAFVGDTAGLQIVSGGFVLPPTPPPDINLPQWYESLSTIERWRPAALFLTHFGPTENVGPHLAELRDHLDLCERVARTALALEADDASKEAWFVDRLRREMTHRMTPADVHAYEMAGRFDLSWKGLLRYLTKGAGARG